MNIAIGTLVIDFLMECPRQDKRHYTSREVNINLAAVVPGPADSLAYRAENVRGPGSGSSVGDTRCSCAGGDVLAGVDAALAQAGFRRVGAPEREGDGPFFVAVVVRV